MSKTRKDKDERMLIISSVATMVSCIALGLSLVSLFYTIYWNQRTENQETYFDPLNYYIDWDYGEEDFQPVVDQINEKTVSLNSKPFGVVASTGGVKSVHCIYTQGEEIAEIKEMRLTDGIDRSTRTATDNIYVLDDYTIYADQIAQSSLDQGKSYYANIFLCVEDYSGNRDLAALVIEYPALKDHPQATDCSFRIYKDIDLLYADNQNRPESLPAYDFEAIKRGKQLKERLKQL